MCFDKIYEKGRRLGIRRVFEGKAQMRQEEAKNKGTALIELVMYAIISFVTVMLGVYIVPNVFSNFLMSGQVINMMQILMGMGILVAVFLSGTILYRVLGNKGFITYLGKMLLVMFLLVGIILAASILSGFVAELIYAKLRDSKTITEIKGIIDVASKVISMLILPMGIHIFWLPIDLSKEKGIKKYWPSIIKYFKLGILLAVLMCVGFMLRVTLPDDPFSPIKMFSLTAVGVVSFYISKNICLSQKRYDSKRWRMKRKVHKLILIFLMLILTFTAIPVEAFSHVERVNRGPLIAMPRPVTVMNEEETQETVRNVEEADFSDSGEVDFEDQIKVDIGVPEERDETEGSDQDVNSDPIESNSEEVELKEPEIYYEEEQIDGEIVVIDKDSVTYKTGARAFTTVVGGDPIVYEDSEGEIQEIDNTLIENTSHESYINASNSYEIELPKEMTDRHGVTIEKDGYIVELIPIEGDFTNSVVKNNAILYNAVFPGIDYQYTTLASGVKEDIVLNEKTDINEFSFEIKTNLNVNLVERNGETLIYISSDGQNIFILSSPIMTDANAAFSFNVKLSLDKVNGKYIVTVNPDVFWLDSDERVYPVRIDPSTITISGDDITLYSVQEDIPEWSGGRDYIFSGYDDGIDSGTSAFGTMHLRTRAYAWLNYDFSKIDKEAKINSAVLTFYQWNNISEGKTLFGAYRIESEWDGSELGWNRQENFSHELISTAYSDTDSKTTTWDIKTAVQSWVNGIYPNYGIVVKAVNNENQDQCEVFRGTSKPAKLVIEWEIPNPVNEEYSLDDTTINLHPITEKDINGKQKFDAVFASGIAKPKSAVGYELKEANISGVSPAYASYKFPDSETFSSIFPSGTKYKSKDGNWQTGLFGASDIKNDTMYKIAAHAIYESNIGKEVESDTFLIYKAKGNETLPNIAKYYGVPLETIMRDNHVQDAMVIQNNTLFIRNPKKETPYVSGLTIDDKKLIDASLMGRGLHCEYGFEPINLNTGNFYLNAVDISIEDLGEAFGIERTYNSKAVYNNSVFGRNWSFKYDEHISKLENGDIVYSTGDGKLLVFTYDNDQYISPLGYHYGVKEIPYKVKIPEEDQKEDGPAEYELVKYEIYDKDGSYRAFDSFGQLEKIIDKYGYETKLFYDNSLNLTEITSPSGKTINLSYNDRGKIIEASIPNGKTLKYSYDDEDNLISFTDAENGEIRYEYKGGLMTSWIDQDGNRVVLNEYDESGRVTKQTDANGNISTLSYMENSTATVDANKNKTVYTYDSLKRTIKISYPNGKVETFKYDDKGNLLSDYNLSYTYDDRGNVLTETRKDGVVKSYTYNGNNDVTSITDYDGSVTRFDYSGSDLIKIIYPDSSVNSYTYDNLHRIISHVNGEGVSEFFKYDSANISSYTDFNGNTYTFTYDKHNNITSIKDPTGGVSQYSYNGNDWKIAEYFPDGSTHTYIFDRVGNVTSIKDGNGGVSTFTYDKVGNLITGTDPKGGTITYSYDGVNNKISETDALGRKSLYSYDPAGNVTSFTDVNGNETLFTYDVDGNLLESSYSDGSKTSAVYDALNRLTKGIDELGNITEFRYDSLSRITEVSYPDGTELIYTYDEMGNLTSFIDETGLENKFSYDGNSNITSLTQGDRVYRYFYDQNGNLIKTVDVMGYETSFSYDALNRIISKTNENGASTNYSYDALGRIIELTDALGYKTSFEHDLNGNLKRIVTPRGGEYLYNYNALDNLISEKNPIGSITNYEYNGVEELTKVTDALTGETKYSYDGLSNITKVTDALGNSAGLSYDKKGNLTAITLSNGDKSTYEYDFKGRLVKKTDAAGLVTQYEYDSMDRMIHEKDNAGNGIKYSYDNKGRLLKIEDVIGRTEEYEYDEFSRVISLKEIDGNVSTFTYDNLGRVSSYTDHKGLQTTFTYDGVGNLLEENTNDEKIYKYTYDLLNRVTEHQNPLKEITKYIYDEEGNIIGIVDGNGIETGYEYNLVSDVIKYIDGNKNETFLEYDALSRLIKLTQPEGNIEEYRYDAVSNLIQFRDGNSYVTEYEYDIFGNLIKEISPRGAVTSYTYDKHNNITEIKDALGYITKYDVDLNGLTTKTTLPNGGEYLYSYDAVHRVTGIRTPNGYEKTFTYDNKGNIITESDNMDRIYAYSYDDDHNITKEINSNGLETIYSYDNYGNLLTVLEGKERKTAYTYDLLDRLIGETNPEGKLTKVSYDKGGNISDVTLSGERTTKYSYDGNYNLIAITEPMGYVSKFTYDKNDRLVSIIDAKGNAEAYSYDEVGQIKEIVDKNGNERVFSYDAHGNITKSVNERGKTLAYTYDLVNNLTEVSSGVLGETRYEYDGMGNIISSLTGGGKTLYTYDLENNLIEVKDPRGKTEKLEYDLAGNIKKSVRPDKSSVSYDYDKLNAIISKEYSEDSSKVKYSYDNYGNRVEMTDSSGDTEYSYDILGRLTSIIDTFGREVKYTYDDAGRLESIAYPEGNKVSYSYDLNDRLISVDDSGEITKYTYNELNQLTETIRPDGSKTTYSYDKNGNVIELINCDSSGNYVSTFKYTYDEIGNITKEVSTNNGESSTREYEYNDANELVSFIDAGSDGISQVYEYDKSGNRTKLKTSDETITYAYNESNQLISKASSKNGKTKYTYDNNGNLAKEESNDSVITYEYTAAQRLSIVRRNGELLMAMSYDGDGNRIFKVSVIEYEEEVTSNIANIEVYGTPKSIEKETVQTIKPEEYENNLGINTYSETKYVDPDDSIFWYGFGQTFLNLSSGANTALAYTATSWLNDAWNLVTDKFDVIFHHAEYDKTDITSMRNAGLTDEDIEEILKEIEKKADSKNIFEIQEETSYTSGVYQSNSGINIQSSSEIITHTNYELTYYVNDINRKNVEVLSEYTSGDALVNSYTYGNQRISIDTNNPNLYNKTGISYYLYDGRGSVSNVVKSDYVLTSYSYDPYGNVTSDIPNSFTNYYGYNGEDTSHVTSLQYLRYRYYDTSDGRFNSPDNYLGQITSALSKNRYAYTENNPISYIDPSGHARNSAVMMSDGGGGKPAYPRGSSNASKYSPIKPSPSPKAKQVAMANKKSNHGASSTLAEVAAAVSNGTNSVRKYCNMSTNPGVSTYAGIGAETAAIISRRTECSQTEVVRPDEEDYYDELYEELSNRVNQDLTWYERIKNIGFYSTSDALNKVIEMEDVIIATGEKYGADKTMIQTVLFKELRMIDVRDVFADHLVTQYYNYKADLNNYVNSNAWNRFITDPPQPPLISVKDSSTGVGQIFAQTAIRSWNMLVERGITDGDLLNEENEEDVYNTWRRLSEDEQFNVEMIGIVLRSEALNCNIEYDFENYTDDDIKTVFMRYNGSGYSAKKYGEQLFDWREIFEKYR